MKLASKLFSGMLSRGRKKTDHCYSGAALRSIPAANRCHREAIDDGDHNNTIDVHATADGSEWPLGT